MMAAGDLPAAVRLISDDMIRAMCIRRNEAKCRRRLDAYQQAGLSHHGMLYGMPIGQVLRTSVHYLERLQAWWST